MPDSVALNQDINKPATLRNLADAIEARDVGVTTVDHGFVDGLAPDDPLMQRLEIHYVPTTTGEELSDVVELLPKSERV